LADFFGVQLPSIFSVGKAGETPSHTGLREEEAHREALQASRLNPFGLTQMKDENGRTTTFFGGSEGMF
jgi:hypothetical protein